MYSAQDTPKGGFPHSDTSGSKLICQLPEAFRRLSRLSSPIIAKASTICSYSLDPITLNSPATTQGSNQETPKAKIKERIHVIYAVFNSTHTFTKQQVLSKHIRQSKYSLTQSKKLSLTVNLHFKPLRISATISNADFDQTTGLVRVRSPLLTESRLMSFPPGTEMFQFPGFAFLPYIFR